MKRFLLLLICLLCCLTLTACYVDNDPWPASAPMNEAPTAVPTAVPTTIPTPLPTQPTASAAPTAQPTMQPAPTAQPTMQPAPTAAVEAPVQPERTPGGESDPGING